MGLGGIAPGQKANKSSESEFLQVKILFAPVYHIIPALHFQKCPFQFKFHDVSRYREIYLAGR